MTDYNKEYPELDFIIRTREIICQYEQYVPKSKKHHEVTLLINCLLGLLVLPKGRRLLKHIPKEPIKKLEDWGLKLEHILNAGKEPEYCPECNGTGILRYEGQKKGELTLRQFIKEMRHCVAHIRFAPCAQEGQIKNLKFSNKSEFEAEIPVDCLKTFVTEFGRELLNGLKQSNISKGRNRA